MCRINDASFTFLVFPIYVLPLILTALTDMHRTRSNPRARAWAQLPGHYTACPAAFRAKQRDHYRSAEPEERLRKKMHTDVVY